MIATDPTTVGLLASAFVVYGTSMALFAVVLARMLTPEEEDMHVTKKRGPLIVGRKPSITLEPEGVTGARLSVEHEGDELVVHASPEELKEFGCMAIALSVEIAQARAQQALAATIPSIAPNGSRS